MSDAPKLIICPCLCDSNNNDDGSCIRDFVVMDALVGNREGKAFTAENSLACRYYKVRVADE